MNKLLSTLYCVVLQQGDVDVRAFDVPHDTRLFIQSFMSQCKCTDKNCLAVLCRYICYLAVMSSYGTAIHSYDPRNNYKQFTMGQSGLSLPSFHGMPVIQQSTITLIDPQFRENLDKNNYVQLMGAVCCHILKSVLK